MVRLIWRPALLVAVALTATLPAYAQPASPTANADLTQRRAQAATLADTAYDLMNKGLYVDAIDLFRKADARFHSPMFTVFIARCQDKLGRPADALANMERAANEQLADYAPASFRKAQDEARAAIPALMMRVPTVTVDAAGGSGATLVIDGKPAAFGTPVRLNPGNHQVVAMSAGESQKQEVSLAEGQAENLRFEFGVDQVTGADNDTGASYVAPGIAFGVGGVGLLIGAVAGGIFIGRADEHKEACSDDGVCPPELAAEGEEIRTLGDVSTAGFVIGGVGLVTGTVLMIVTSTDSGGEPAALRLGPTGASLTVAF